MLQREASICTAASPTPALLLTGTAISPGEVGDGSTKLCRRRSVSFLAMDNSESSRWMGLPTSDPSACSNSFDKDLGLDMRLNSSSSTDPSRSDNVSSTNSSRYFTSRAHLSAGVGYSTSSEVTNNSSAVCATTVPPSTSKGRSIISCKTAMMRERSLGSNTQTALSMGVPHSSWWTLADNRRMPVISITMSISEAVPPLNFT